MPDEKGNTEADEAPVTDTPDGAYKDGREEDIKGDTEQFLSNDPQKQQADDISDDDEVDLAPDKQ